MSMVSFFWLFTLLPVFLLFPLLFFLPPLLCKYLVSKVMRRRKKKKNREQTLAVVTLLLFRKVTTAQICDGGDRSSVRPPSVCPIRGVALGHPPSSPPITFAVCFLAVVVIIHPIDLQHCRMIRRRIICHRYYCC